MFSNFNQSQEQSCKEVKFATNFISEQLNEYIQVKNQQIADTYVSKKINTKYILD